MAAPVARSAATLLLTRPFFAYKPGHMTVRTPIILLAVLPCLALAAQPAGLEPNIVGEGRPHGQVRRLDTPSELRLSGLVNFRGTKLAILEGERRFGGVQAVILEPGQS